jgi:hypothetical protein
MLLLASWLLAQAPPVQLAVLLTTQDNPDYTKVEIKGQLQSKGQDYQVKSQERSWRLEMGGDKVLLFLAKKLDNEPVVVTGWLRIDVKLDTVQVIRIEPVKPLDK